MPRLLHDPAVRESIRTRVSNLTPNTQRAWGTMAADQMLWHCSVALEAAMGRTPHAPLRFPLPRFVIKFMVLSMPWPKGAPTHPDFVAGARYDFEAERARCLRLIDEFAAMSIESSDWTPSPAFGKATGREWSQLEAKHLEHHLRQFGA